MKTLEEVVVTFKDDADDHPIAIMYSNGAHTFYRLKKMNREEVSTLLGVNELKK